jgi:hypothetical protein
MNDLKHEGKLSTKNKALVLVCLTITLLGIALVPIYFPALRNELSDILFIAMVIGMTISFFRGGEMNSRSITAFSKLDFKKCKSGFKLSCTLVFPRNIILYILAYHDW